MASKLFIFYVKHKFNEFDDLFPKIRVAEFRILPIPTKIKGMFDNDIITLVKSILSAKRTNPSADISAEEQKIDCLVYHLYNLTYDEVKIVDPETPITEEEYYGQ